MVYDDAQAWKDVGDLFPDMTIHYVFILRKGPTWSADETPEIQALQEAHVANYRRLAEMGKLVVNGPFRDTLTPPNLASLPGKNGRTINLTIWEWRLK